MGCILINNNIIILDESLINKIAAGEVIERPASIVKELIENSIDANSKKIVIEIKEGGKSFIKIIDDGDGMSKKNLELCYLRHSTSKIKDLNDLFSINSLGFRGEALASISSVSHTTIISKTKNEISGHKIVIQGGKQIVFEEFGVPKGTIIEIKNLFFNTPARKKYLKNIAIEQSKIIDIVTRYALIYPQLQFKLINNSKIIMDIPSTTDSINLSFIYGNEVAKNMIELNFDNGFIQINGFISKPNINRASKKDQSIYVNNRYIKNKIISDAINNAYHTLVMINRYPIAVINIKIDVKKIDVNVHPQKSEIRLKHENEIYDSVYNAVKNTLKNNDLIPQVLHNESAKTITDFSNSNFESNYKVEDSTQKMLIKESGVVKPNVLDELKILGIINKTYIIAETKGNVILIDQHAAAERILYEKFTNELKDKKVSLQNILEPVVLELSPKDFSIAISNQDILNGLGYKIEEFGHNAIIIRTIPIVLGRQFDKSMFMDFLENLSKNKKPKTLEDFFHTRIARMACRTAIKAGDEITLPQIKKYVQELMNMDVPYTCPHGRPIMIKWSFYELEKMFKRVV